MRSIALVVLLAVAVAGCSSWRPVAGGVAAVPEMPDRVRVVLRDSTAFVLEQPMVVGDSLRGIVDGDRIRTIGRDQIRLIEVRKGDASKTVGLILLIGFVGFGLLVIGWSAYGGYL